MVFASRQDAGQKLGAFLKRDGITAEIILGLPRGGVIVAAAVASVMRLPLDVLVVRKIGHPWFREYAVGALGENGVVIIDEEALGKNPAAQTELSEVIAEESHRLSVYEGRFHIGGRPQIAGKRVLLVDDGLATGATAEAAVLSARNCSAGTIIVASPVASTSAVTRLGRVADMVKALVVDPEFDAVGHYYEVFSQTTDEEVLQCLRAVRDTTLHPSEAQ